VSDGPGRSVSARSTLSHNEKEPDHVAGLPATTCLALAPGHHHPRQRLFDRRFLVKLRHLRRHRLILRVHQLEGDVSSMYAAQPSPAHDIRPYRQLTWRSPPWQLAESRWVVVLVWNLRLLPPYWVRLMPLRMHGTLHVRPPWRARRMGQVEGRTPCILLLIDLICSGPWSCTLPW
jgi:hypothetical protein